MIDKLLHLMKFYQIRTVFMSKGQLTITQYGVVFGIKRALKARRDIMESESGIQRWSHSSDEMTVEAFGIASKYRIEIKPIKDFSIHVKDKIAFDVSGGR